MIKFKRNKDTGILEVWKNGKKVGIIKAIGDYTSKKERKR